MAWRKELAQLIEDLETIVFYTNEAWDTLRRGKRWMSLDKRAEALSYLDSTGRWIHETRDLAKEMRGRYPGGSNPPHDWHSSNEIAKDIRFAIRRLEELKYEGSMIDAEAKTRLERALEKLGAGDG